LRTKRGIKPRFHTKSRDAREDLEAELDVFLSRYWPASEALRSDPTLAISKDFPPGCYPPALAFVGDRPPPRPPAPPTRVLVVDGSEVMDRGEIPVVVVPVVLPAGPDARARGQPP
jgi:hypothetical protein